MVTAVKMKKIMIISKNYQIISRVRYYLNYFYKNKIQISIVENSYDVLENVINIHPYIIFLDGEIDGISAFELIIRIEKLKLKNYILLASSAKDLKSSFLKIGVTAFIPKPFDYKMIINNCEKILHHSSEPIKDIMDPVKCFFFFEYISVLKTLTNDVNSRLLPLNIKNFDITILNENNEYIFWKYSNEKWQDMFTQLFFKDLMLHHHYPASYINMTSSEENFYAPLSYGKHADIRKKILQKEDGYYLFLYDNKFKCKLAYTLILNDSKKKNEAWWKEVLKILDVYHHRFIAVFNCLILKDTLSFTKNNSKEEIRNKPADFLINFINK